MDKNMKAFVLHGVGDFRYEEVPLPELTAHTALVKVQAAGICGSDIPRVYVNGTYHFPTIPGHEFSGEVVAVREDAEEDEKKWMGKKTGIFPLIPCGTCDPCRKKWYEMCQRYSYLGSREDGGFAEYVKVPLWNLIELPEKVTYEQAAMLEPMAVAVHAIRKAMERRLGPDFLSDCQEEADSDKYDGISVAVCGLGTIGMLIVMFLQAMGFSRIIGIGNKDFQKKIFLEVTNGQGIYVDSRNGQKPSDALDRIALERGNLKRSGVDVYFECVGKQENIQNAIDCAAPGGSVQLVGNPASDISLPRDVYWKILRRQLIVTGTWNSSYTHEKTDDWNYVLRMLAAGRINPEKLITHQFSLEKLASGFEIMRDKTEPYIKVMGKFL